MDYITIDDFTTLPEYIKILLDNKTNDLERWHEKLRSQEITGNLEVVIDKIHKYLIKTNPNIITFHATRLFEYELNDILDNGFKIPTQGFIEDRLKRMCKYMEFNDITYQTLLKNTSLKRQNPNSKYYFIATSLTLDDFGFRDIYKYWGGESIFFHSFKHNPEEFKLLSKQTYPYLIISNLKFDEIDDQYLAAKKIVKFYIKQKLKYEISSSNDGFESRSSTPPKILKIIRYDDKAFRQYVGEELFNVIK